MASAVHVLSKVHLDVNMSRVFTLNPKDKDHLRTLMFNARSANLLIKLM